MSSGRLATLGFAVLMLAGPALAQTSVEPTTTLPGVQATPDLNATPPGSLPPGVSDPTTTGSTPAGSSGSTTGTANHSDHCQSPGTAADSNPTADIATVPRADAACR